MRFLCSLLHNRLPNGIVYRSLVESRRLYREYPQVSFYRLQYLHNIRVFWMPSRRRSSMKYALTERAVPPTLYHITAAENTASILQKGLLAGYNPAVFLTDSAPYLQFLKKRYPTDGYALFAIRAADMVQDGFLFFNERQADRSSIWVTQTVPPQYLQLTAPCAAVRE